MFRHGKQASDDKLYFTEEPFFQKSGCGISCDFGKWSADQGEPSNRGVKLPSLGHIFERLLMFRIAKTSWLETNVVTSTKGDC